MLCAFWFVGFGRCLHWSFLGLFGYFVDLDFLVSCCCDVCFELFCFGIDSLFLLFNWLLVCVVFVVFVCVGLVSLLIMLFVV